MTQLVCRTCLEEILDSNCVNLDDDANKIKQKLIACVPEMNLKAIPNACICTYCANRLQTAYDFKQRCLRTEEKIRIHKNLKDLSQIKENIEGDDKFDVVHGVGIGMEVVFIRDDNLFEEEVISDFPNPLITESDSISSFLNNTNKQKKKKQRGEINDTKVNKATVVNGRVNGSKKSINHNIKSNQVKDKKPKGVVESTKVSKSKAIFETNKVSTRASITPKTEKSLRNNSTFIADKLNYKCSNCTFATPIESYLKKHKIYCKVSTTPNGSKKEATKNDKMFKCSQCSFKSLLKSAIDLHTKRIHKSGNQFKCSKCSYAADNIKLLKQHDVKSHTLVAGNEFKYKCNMCPFGTDLAKGMKLHLRKHRKDKIFSCQLCYFKAEQKIHLDKHTAKHHPKQNSLKKSNIGKIEKKNKK